MEEKVGKPLQPRVQTLRRRGKIQLRVALGWGIGWFLISTPQMARYVSDLTGNHGWSQLEAVNYAFWLVGGGWFNIPIILILIGLGTLSLVQARRLYTTAALPAEPDAAGFFNQGIALAKEKRYRVAEKAFMRAVQLDPGLTQSWYHAGVCRQEAGDDRAAIVIYKKMLSINPTHAASWYNLGPCQARTGDLAGAVDSYHHALRADAKDPETWVNLACALYLLGKEGEALFCWQEAAKLGHPFAPQRVIALRQRHVKERTHTIPPS